MREKGYRTQREGANMSERRGTGDRGKEQTCQREGVQETGEEQTCQREGVQETEGRSKHVREKEYRRQREGSNM